MKTVWMFAIGFAAGLGAIVVPRIAGLDLVAHVHRHFVRQSDAALVHTEEKFEFTANGRLEDVAPLMGADRERAWAPGWNPHFVYPKPASDQRGMVFTVSHGPFQVPWVNTEFDTNAGRVQYVYVIPDTLVTLITIRLTSQGDSTHVAVEYDRTALNAEANSHVQHLAENDRNSGPEWAGQINALLKKEGKGKP